MLKLAGALSLAGLSLAIMVTPVQAASGDPELQNVANAIAVGNYVGAEAMIARLSREDRMDGALLINLGNAYAGMGRRADAEIAYQAAINADPDMELDLADGSVRSVREVANDGLRFLGVSYAGR